MLTFRRFTWILCAAALVSFSGCAIFDSASTESEPVGTPSIAQAQYTAVDISGLRNASATGGEAAFDTWGNAYPADQLPSGRTTVNGDSVVFELPDFAKAENNMVTAAGQTVEVPAGNYAALYVLAAASEENQQAKLTLAYGQEKAEAAFKITDWCAEPAFGEQEVGSYKRLSGENEAATCKLFMQKIDLDPTRELNAIVLPNNKNIHIFAVTLGK